MILRALARWNLKEIRLEIVGSVLNIRKAACRRRIWRAALRKFNTEHVLLECKVFNDTRKHYFRASTMKDLFENVHMDNVLSFLKETGLYQKI